MVPRKWPQGRDWFAKLNLLVRTILQWRLVPLAGKLILGCSADNFVLNEDRGNTFRLIKTNPQKTLAGKTDPGVLGWQLPSNERGFCDFCELEPMGGLSCHHWTEKEQGYYLGFCEIKRNASVIGCLNTFRLRISSGAWHWVQTKVACSLLCRRCLWCWSNCFRLTFATPLRSLMECCHRDCSAT